MRSLTPETGLSTPPLIASSTGDGASVERPRAHVGAHGRPGRLGVYRTRDAGASWELYSDGLPEPAWVAVLREGMAYDRLDPAGVYLGTQSGSIFVSSGDGWVEAASQLPLVLSVEAGAWQ
jgi:hypothetical protein